MPFSWSFTSSGASSDTQARYFLTHQQHSLIRVPLREARAGHCLQRYIHSRHEKQSNNWKIYVGHTRSQVSKRSKECNYSTLLYVCVVDSASLRWASCVPTLRRTAEALKPPPRFQLQQVSYPFSTLTLLISFSNLLSPPFSISKRAFRELFFIHDQAFEYFTKSR